MLVLYEWPDDLSSGEDHGDANNDNNEYGA
jgi:hypothetical protein